MVAQRAQHMVVDVGGSHVTAAAVTVHASGAAELASRIERPVDAHAPSATVLDAWAAACSDAAAAAGVDARSADWGLAMPGPFDYDRGIGRYAGVGKFDGLAGVDIRSALADRLNVAPERIRFVHDAGAYGIGEWRFGAPDRHTRHARFVCVTLGTGVGSAFVDAGSLVFDRADVPPGGELHRLTFDGRALEETVSTRAILAQYASPDPTLTVKQLATRARSGDDRARAVFTTAMEALGLALAPWLDAFGATALVVGGSISRSWDILEPGLRTGLAATAPPPAGVVGPALELAPSRLLADAPLYGAAHLLREAAAGPCVTAPALA